MTSVLTASPSASSHAATTARLCGIVTFAPTNPSVCNADTAATTSSTSKAEKYQSSRAAAKAAFCIAGESVWATGWPRSATWLAIAVLREELVVSRPARREEVVPVILLARVVEVVDVRRVGCRTDRGEARVRDRRRRQAEVEARVVGRRIVKLRLVDRLGRRDVEPVTERRVDAERDPSVEPVVDDGCDERALARNGGLPFDHRSDGQHVVRREVLRARVSHVDAVPVPAERGELRLHELTRRRLAQEVVGRREEEPLEVRASRAVEAAHDGAPRRGEIGGLVEAHRAMPFPLGDLRDDLHARAHLLTREALREDDPERLRRRGRRSGRRRRRRGRAAATGRSQRQDGARDGGYEAVPRHSR